MHVLTQLLETSKQLGQRGSPILRRHLLQGFIAELCIDVHRGKKLVTLNL